MPKKTYTKAEVDQLVQSAVAKIVAELGAQYESQLKTIQDDCDAKVRQARQMAKEHSAECQRLRGELPARKGA